MSKNLLASVLEDQEIYNISNKLKQQVVNKAVDVLEDHYNFNLTKISDDLGISYEQANEFLKLSLFTHFHQQDGRGGGHTIISAEEAYNAVSNMSDNDKELLTSFDKTLQTLLKEDGVNLNYIIDIAMLRLVKDQSMFNLSTHQDAPKNAFLPVAPNKDGRVDVICRPDLFNINSVRDEREFFRNKKIENEGKYSATLIVHDLTHAIAQQYNPNGLSKINYSDFDKYTKIQEALFDFDVMYSGFNTFKSSIKPMMRRGTFDGMSPSQKVSEMSDIIKDNEKDNEITPDERLIAYSGTMPCVTTFEVVPAYLESKFFFRSSPDEISIDGTEFNSNDIIHRLEKLAEYYDPNLPSYSLLTLPDGEKIPYPSQKLTTLQDVANTYLIAQQFVSKQFTESLVQDTLPQNDNSPLINRRASSNLEFISKYNQDDINNTVYLKAVNTAKTNQLKSQFQHSVSTAILTGDTTEIREYFSLVNKLHQDLSGRENVDGLNKYQEKLIQDLEKKHIENEQSR